jgi:hypothetical protein
MGVLQSKSGRTEAARGCAESRCPPRRRACKPVFIPAPPHRHVQDFSVDVPDHKKEKKTYTVWNQMVGRRRSRMPIYSVHAVSGALAIPGTALDCGVSCTWRRSWQKLQIPILRVQLEYVFDPRADFQRPSAQ